MPRPRSQLISLNDTPYYHCVSRCVRRAFLCGEDKYTGKSYEHRRSWVENRLLFLASVFCMDICAYAVMSNHTHVVLHVDKKKAQQLSDKNVIKRWHRVFNGTLLTQQYVNCEDSRFAASELATIAETASVYRQRLHDISWFMRCLNEHIAREANKEDDCTGRFWEGRFKSQALLDEAALIACMAYVDLNPIRANMAKTPETSDHTSIRRRIRAALDNERVRQLMPFAGNPRENMPRGLPFELNDYLKLVERTGEEARNKSREKLKDELPSLCNRLGFNGQQWITLTTSLEVNCRGPLDTEIIHRRFNAETRHSHTFKVGRSNQYNTG